MKLPEWLGTAWKLFTRRQKRRFAQPQQWQLQTLRVVRALCYLFNVHTLILLVVGCVAVYVCYSLDFRYNMDFTLVATGTTFPLVFTISQAFARRERATVLVANLKASVIGTYWMHRDWNQTENYPASLGNDGQAWAVKVRVILTEFCMHVHRYLSARDIYESIAERHLEAKKHEALLELFVHSTRLEQSASTRFARRVHRLEQQDPGHAHLVQCYRCLSLLSVCNEQLTLKAGYTRGGEGGLSRTNQYLRYIASNLEELRMIREYRTPYMMRTACGVLLHIFVIILAPYFAHFCDSWMALGNDEETCPAGYAASIVYVIIVMLLYHIEVDMEQPFDGSGLDDVFFTVGDELSDVIGINPLSARHSEDLDSSLAGTSPTRKFSSTGGGGGWSSSGHLDGMAMAGSSSGHGLHALQAPRAVSAKELHSGSKPLRPINSNRELNMNGDDDGGGSADGDADGEGGRRAQGGLSPAAARRGSGYVAMGVL